MAGGDDRIHFESGAFGQRRDLDRCASRPVRPECGLVDPVEFLKISQVDQIDGGLNHIRHLAAGGFENCVDVGQNLPGLGFDIGSDDLTGPGVQRDLSGEKQKTPGGHRLAVRPDSRGRAI